jgi:hypothetical protein
MQGFMSVLPFVDDLETTLDRVSYGEPLTTGQGMTTALRPEAKGMVELATMFAPGGRFAKDAAVSALKSTKGFPVGMSIKDIGTPQEAATTAGMTARAGSKTADALAATNKTQSIVREGNPIQSAVVLIGDKIFTGRTHTDAFNRAIYEGVVRRDGGKFIYPKDAEINSDLFMTKDGQIIDRLQASKMFDIGASETAIKEGLMQNKPAGSISVDSYIKQAEVIKKQREKQ